MKYPDKKLGRKRKGVIELRKSQTPTIIAKYPGECSRCHNWISKGEMVKFDIEKRTIRHASRTCKQASSKRATSKGSQ